MQSSGADQKVQQPQQQPPQQLQQPQLQPQQQSQQQSQQVHKHQQTPPEKQQKQQQNQLRLNDEDVDWESNDEQTEKNNVTIGQPNNLHTRDQNNWKNQKRRTDGMSILSDI